MDSFVSIRLPGLVLTDEKSHTKSANQNIVVEGSDEILIQRIAEGSRESLTSFFRRYARLVRSIAFRVVRDASEADDVLQDTFLYVHRKAGLYDQSRCSARSWIVQIAYHRAISRRRYLQSRHNLYAKVDTDDFEVMSSGPHGAGLDDLPIEMVGTATMQGLLATLTPDQRDTLTLYFYEGYTFDEISVKLNQTHGNIRNHYYRGLDKLRKKIFAAKLPGRNGCGKK